MQIALSVGRKELKFLLSFTALFHVRQAEL